MLSYLSVIVRLGMDPVSCVSCLGFVSSVLFLDNNDFKCLDELAEKCRQHKNLWLKLEDEKLRESQICEAFLTVNEALKFLINQDQFDLLVTGSIHLVGSVLSLIEPRLND